ncbi:MAG: glycosyltransferase [Bdellovibrionales bacterium]|nr:glycosyltransferase [Bdellovibrionales bacterium]
MDVSKSGRVAVVVTTYNNPRSLELCLLSLRDQRFKDFEVHVADDGSGEKTRELLLRLKRELPFEIYHHWHPDEGYRKAKINNSVFRDLDPARIRIVVCIDHDVVLHPLFLEDHFRMHQKEGFGPLLFMGRRVDLGPWLSGRINAENVFRFQRGLSAGLFLSALRGETKNILRSFRLEGPPWLLALLKRDRVYDLLGSNYSIDLKSLRDVNGYNEDYKGYWGEDGDLFVRIRNKGIKCIGVIGYAIQWHIYHDRIPETPEHVSAYKALLSDTEYMECRNGILKK